MRIKGRVNKGKDSVSIRFNTGLSNHGGVRSPNPLESLSVKFSWILKFGSSFEGAVPRRRAMMKFPAVLHRRRKRRSSWWVSVEGRPRSFTGEKNVLCSRIINFKAPIVGSCHCIPPEGFTRVHHNVNGSLAGSFPDLNRA